MESLHSKNKMYKISKTCIVCLLLLAMTEFFGCGYHASPGGIMGQKKTGKSKIVTFSVIGKGVEPEKAVTKGQAFVMAERAAVMDGYRLLAEKIKGVYVNALSQAGMNSIDYDVINTKVETLLRGVQINDISHNEYGIAQANMQLRVNFTLFDVVWWPEGLSEDVTFTGDSFVYAPINRIKNHLRVDYP